jgi:hypothetical protein
MESQRISSNPLLKHKSLEGGGDIVAEVKPNPIVTKEHNKMKSSFSTSKDKVSSVTEILKVKEIKQTKPPSTSSFDILSEKEESKPPKPQYSSSFAIFSDKEESKPPKPQYSSSFDIFSDKEESKPPKPSSSSSFAIFKDNNNKDNAIVSSNSNKQPLCTSHIEPIASTTTSEEDHDQQLNDIMLELGILDNEDGTINTRLARKDIDSMFCSPSPDIRRNVKSNDNCNHQNENLYSNIETIHDNNGELSAIIESSRDHSVLGITLATPGFNRIDRYESFQ